MPQIETRENEIDGFAVRCTPHAGRPGARLLARLLRYLGPALSKLRGVEIDLTQGFENVEIAELAPAIGGLFEALTPDEFDSLACAILARCSIAMPGADGKLENYDLSKPPKIDEAFTGQLMLMFKVMGWVLEVNFAGFFHEFARSAAAAAERAAAKIAANKGQPSSSSSSPTS